MSHPSVRERAVAELFTYGNAWVACKSLAHALGVKPRQLVPSLAPAVETGQVERRVDDWSGRVAYRLKDLS